MLKIAICLAVMIAGGVAVAQAPPEFEAGQVWTLKDAPAGSRFFIVRVEGDPPVISGYAEGGFTVKGRLSPFITANRLYTEDAIRRSVDKLERTGASLRADFLAVRPRVERDGPANTTVGELITTLEEMARYLSEEAPAQ